MTKDYQIECWFPRSIYVASNVKPELLPELEKYSIKYAEQYGVTRNEKLYVDSGHVTCSKLLRKQYPFSDLTFEIKKRAAQYANELGFNATEDKMHLINIWFNISDEGDFNFPHCHPGSFISGIYYVNTVESNTIEFYDSDYLTGQTPYPDRYTDLSFEQTSYPCIPATMMMWRSNLVHCNPRQMEKGRKIAISFNLEIKKEYD